MTVTRLTHRLAPVLALVLVNVFGTLGQFQWAMQAFGHNWLLAVGFAATLESVSLFLTAEASKALLADVRSGTLRVGAYAVGVLVGCLNYVAHAGPRWSPTAMAIAFGSLSALSPVLWAIHSRSQHRIALQAKGLVDPRAVKFPLLLWMLAPTRTFRMFRLGVTLGINEPATVRTMAHERTALAKLAPVDALRYAYAALGHHDSHAARVYLQARGVLIDQAAIDDVTAGRPPAPPALSTPALPPSDPSAPGAAEDYHAAQLDACASNRDRIRLAFSVLGSWNVPAALRWLSDRGVNVSRTDAYAVARAATGAGPSGAFPVVPVSPAPAGARVNGRADLATAGAR